MPTAASRRRSPPKPSGRKKLGQAINFTGTVPAYTKDPHSGVQQLAHSSLLTIVAKQMGLPITGTRFGYEGPQALDPMSLGIV